MDEGFGMGCSQALNSATFVTSDVWKRLSLILTLGHWQLHMRLWTSHSRSMHDVCSQGHSLPSLRLQSAVFSRLMISVWNKFLVWSGNICINYAISPSTCIYTQTHTRAMSIFQTEEMKWLQEMNLLLYIRFSSQASMAIISPLLLWFISSSETFNWNRLVTHIVPNILQNHNRLSTAVVLSWLC